MPSSTTRRQLLKKIENIHLEDFDSLTMDVFKYQAQYNVLYKEYLSLLNCQVSSILDPSQIPFLPISFFKTHEIKTGSWNSDQTFTSSGTTGTLTSRHHLLDLNFYLVNAKKGFEFFYRPVKELAVLALLPSYLERQGSSLVAMADYFIQLSQYEQSGFFLNNVEELLEVLSDCMAKNIPTLLLGVSFALLDLAENYPQDLKNTIIMETGGMKGRRKEITREELHKTLKDAFNAASIHSEYGMTELLSQGYSKGHGFFYPCPTMKVLTREITDPLSIQQRGKTGVINIIDLANIDSISFIATDDLGKVYEDDSFEILGRLDASDMRGCNLLYV